MSARWLPFLRLHLRDAAQARRRSAAERCAAGRGAAPPLSLSRRASCHLLSAQPSGIPLMLQLLLAGAAPLRRHDPRSISSPRRSSEATA
jgi:hypothetical protein